MKNSIFVLLFAVIGLVPSALSQTADVATLQKTVAIQQAFIASQKKEISDLKQAVKDLQTAAATAQKTADSAQAAANSAQTSANNAQNTANSAHSRAHASLHVQGFWNQSGNYSSCNAQCSSQGLRCLTGQGGPVAASAAESCSQATNVCICAAF
jgi:cell division septum initiation protein DivIVA